MNNELFTELDKLTDSTNNIDFTMPDIGIEIGSTSDYEVEEFKGVIKNRYRKSKNHNRAIESI